MLIAKSGLFPNVFCVYNEEKSGRVLFQGNEFRIVNVFRIVFLLILTKRCGKKRAVGNINHL